MKRLEITQDVVDGMLTYSKMNHPREGILLLRGEVGERSVRVYELMIPPRAVHGRVHSSFDPSMLPMDRSVIGIAHSHPSGVGELSTEDVLNRFGVVQILVTYPYEAEGDIHAFDSDGNRVGFTVVEGNDL